MSLKCWGFNRKTEEDTGSSIVQRMKTVTNQLSALRTDGFIVTLDAPEDTSTPSLTVRYAAQKADFFLTRNLWFEMETLRSYGWDLSLLPKTSKEYLLPFLEKLAGKNGQEVMDILQEYSSPISARTNPRLSSSKSDTETEPQEDSHSVEDMLQYSMERISSAYNTITWRVRKVPGTPSSYELQEFQPWQYHQLQADMHSMNYVPEWLQMESY